MLFRFGHTRHLKRFAPLALAGIAILACSHHPVAQQGDPMLQFKGEQRLSNIRQLTFGGTNAKASWSSNGQWLIDQHQDASNSPQTCDQIFRLSVDGKINQRVSNGLGSAISAFYHPDNSRILYSSTFASKSTCPAPRDLSQGTVWPLYTTYQIYSSKPDGSDTFPIEPGAPRAYNAETATCKDGSIVFTSDRSGDLELYVGKFDSLGTIKDIKQITNSLGYDGEASFSADCKYLVWSASRPQRKKEVKAYRALLKKHLFVPKEVEIWVANADGSQARQLTQLGATSISPHFTSDQTRVIFASNPRDPHGSHFDLYLIGTNGKGLERVTFSNTYDGSPMFSPDGKYLVFSSSRYAKQPSDTNLFVADWVESAQVASAPR
jgi:Tol biopolymer transport system component